MTVSEIRRALVGQGVPDDRARRIAERDGVLDPGTSGAEPATKPAIRGTNPPDRETEPARRETLAKRKRHATGAELAAVVTATAPVEGVRYFLSGRVVSGKNNVRPLMRAIGAVCRLCGIRPTRVAGLAKSKAAEQWGADAADQLRRQHRAGAPFGGPVMVAISLFGPVAHGHAADGDNAQSAIWDALTAAGVLLDDRPAVLREWRGRWCDWPEWGAVVSIHPTTDEGGSYGGNLVAGARDTAASHD